MERDQLFNLAAATLDAVEEHYATEGVDLPARRYVNDGLPSWDCDQLVVWVDRVFVGTVASEAVQAVDCWHERVAVLGVLLVRCTPNVLREVGKRAVFPSTTEIEAHARVVLADATLIEDALLNAAGHEGLGGHRGMAFETWVRQGPEGGFSGGLLRVRVSLTSDVPGY